MYATGVLILLSLFQLLAHVDNEQAHDVTLHGQLLLVEVWSNVSLFFVCGLAQVYL